MKLRPSRYELVDDDGTVLFELPVDKAMAAASAFDEAFPVVNNLLATQPLPIRDFIGQPIPPTSDTPQDSTA